MTALVLITWSAQSILFPDSDIVQSIFIIYRLSERHFHDYVQKMDFDVNRLRRPGVFSIMGSLLLRRMDKMLTQQCKIISMKHFTARLCIKKETGHKLFVNMLMLVLYFSV